MPRDSCQQPQLRSLDPGRTHVWVLLTHRSASQCLCRNSETTIDVKLVTDCGLIANLRILLLRETGLAILFCSELTLNSVMCAYHIETSSRESQVHARHVRVGSISQFSPAARLIPSGTQTSAQAWSKAPWEVAPPSWLFPELSHSLKTFSMFLNSTDFVFHSRNLYHDTNY